jgi:hypothetical protein
MLKLKKKINDVRQILLALLFIFSTLSPIIYQGSAESSSSCASKENSLYQLNHFQKVFSLPRSDLSAIFIVAKKYNLTKEQTWLLCTIRKIENGSTPREFGILTPDAMRFKNDSVRSFFCQAEWCAGTIKKRYKGDLLKFAERYCPRDLSPLNRNWYSNALYYMNKINL